MSTTESYVCACTGKEGKRRRGEGGMRGVVEGE